MANPDERRYARAARKYLEATAKEEAEARRSAAACSRSLDVFESWEQFCRVKITGYTLRDGTDVCRFNFPSGKPNARTTDHITLLINQGWQITAIHYENRELSQPDL